MMSTASLSCTFRVLKEAVHVNNTTGGICCIIHTKAIISLRVKARFAQGLDMRGATSVSNPYGYRKQLIVHLQFITDFFHYKHVIRVQSQESFYDYLLAAGRRQISASHFR